MSGVTSAAAQDLRTKYPPSAGPGDKAALTPAAAAAPAGPSPPAAVAQPPAELEPPADMLRLLSTEGRRRTSGSLRDMVSQFSGVEGLVGLHGGLPPEHSFPLTSLQFGLEDGTTVQLSAVQLAAAQQYNISAAGYPPLLHWVARHVREMHAPPGPHGVLVTDGASHALEVRKGSSRWGCMPRRTSMVCWSVMAPAVQNRCRGAVGCCLLAAAC